MTIIPEEIEEAIEEARESGASPIVSDIINGWYRLKGANGEERQISAGTGNTILADASWPGEGEDELLWKYATPVEPAQPSGHTCIVTGCAEEAVEQPSPTVWYCERHASQSRHMTKRDYDRKVQP